MIILRALVQAEDEQEGVKAGKENEWHGVASEDMAVANPFGLALF